MNSKNFIEPLFLDSKSTDFSRLMAVFQSSQGYNKSDQPSMLQANNDVEAIKTFLLDYKSTALTYRSYLKEIERLCLWCLHVPKITISDLKREHLIAYQEFLEDPQPYEQWCGKRQAKLLKNGEFNMQWRPFVSGISKPTLKKTISILDSFFSYLVQNNYFAGNPLAVDKRRKGSKSNSTERWLEKDEINTTLEALDNLLLSGEQDEQLAFSVTRAKYIIQTLFYTGLRLNELTKHSMGDFVLIEDEWFLKVVGKGEKPRKIVVVDEYLEILTTFRATVGLIPLPEFKEQTPIIPSTTLKSSISDNRIGQILNWALEHGAKYYEQQINNTKIEISAEQILKYQHKAAKLRKASAHWLRHSYGTYLVKSGCQIEKVKELMGHSDISTTMIYVHIAKNDLHESARGLSLQD